MSSMDTVLSLAVALGIGLLIGMEREQSHVPHRDLAKSGFLGGARTHPLFALTGAISVLLAEPLGKWVVGATFASMVLLLGAAYWDNLRRQGDRGLTSEVAFLLTFLLGAFCVADTVIAGTSIRLAIAGALGVAITILLSAKPVLLAFIEHVSKEDVYATLKFLLVAIIVLPFLPDMGFGPFEALNPFQIGLMVVLITGLSFAGYVAYRVIGTKQAMAVIGLVGGLVSSTAVTFSVARQVTQSKSLRSAGAVAVILASTVMFVRVAVEVAIVHAALLVKLGVPLLVMTVAAAAGAAVLHIRTGATKREPTAAPELKNPVELRAAVTFGIVFAVVLLGARAAQAWLGDPGLYAAGVLAGLTDVDAITLSVAKLAQGGLDGRVASLTILLGVAANTLVKAGIAMVVGGWRFGLRFAAIVVPALALGLGAAALL